MIDLNEINKKIDIAISEMSKEDFDEWDIEDELRSAIGKYVGKQFIDFGDLNELAEHQIIKAFLSGVLYNSELTEKELCNAGILTGESARIFQERMENPPKISKEELDRMRKAHEMMLNITYKPIKEKFYKEFNEKQYVNKSLCDKIFDFFKEYMH